MNKLTTPVRRFCQAILRQYPLMKKELAALEEEKQAIAKKVSVATWIVAEGMLKPSKPK